MRRLTAILYYRLFGNGLAYAGPFWWSLGEILAALAGSEAIQAVAPPKRQAWRFVPSPWAESEER